MNRKQLSPGRASKFLKEQYQERIRRLAGLKYLNDISIIDSRTRRLRKEVYSDLGTAREVAAAVELLAIIHGIPAKWNQAERRKLFNQKIRQPKKSKFSIRKAVK